MVLVRPAPHQRALLPAEYKVPLSTQTRINSRRTGLVKKVSRCPHKRHDAARQSLWMHRSSGFAMELRGEEGEKEGEKDTVGRTDGRRVGGFCAEWKWQVCPHRRPSDLRSDDLACRFCKLHANFARGTDLPHKRQRKRRETPLSNAKLLRGRGKGVRTPEEITRRSFVDGHRDGGVPFSCIGRTHSKWMSITETGGSFWSSLFSRSRRLRLHLANAFGKVRFVPSFLHQLSTWGDH